MANRNGQMELPRTSGRAKDVKKQRVRKMRAESKNNLDFNPMYNRYKGYS